MITGDLYFGNCDGLPLALANQARGFQSAHLGHHHVHEDQIVGFTVERLQRFEPIGSHVGPIPHLLEQTERDLLVDDVVIAQQHAQRQTAGQGGVRLGARREPLGRRVWRRTTLGAGFPGAGRA